MAKIIKFLNLDSRLRLSLITGEKNLTFFIKGLYEHHLMT